MTAVTNVYLVRHAHSVYTPDERGRPLSSDGLKQAQKVADLLRTHDIDVVVSSPYRRAVQTVAQLAAELNKEVMIEEDFRERMLSNRPVTDFFTAVERLWDNPCFSYPGGESNQAAQLRGVRALKKLLKKYSGKSIVVGTHGNIMTLIMNYYDPQCDYSFWRRLSMPDIYRLTFSGERYCGAERMWRDD